MLLPGKDKLQKLSVGIRPEFVYVFQRMQEITMKLDVGICVGLVATFLGTKISA